MENSNTLPKIEVGDTVIFRTDLKAASEYGLDSFMPDMVNFIKQNQIVSLVFRDYFYVENGGNWYFTPEMVAQVIKPTKERVYSESEMRKAIEMARVGNKSFWGYTADAIIESLNK